MMLPAALAGELLRDVAGYGLVEQGLLLAGLAQEPAQALDVLANAAGAGQDDADTGRRYIHPLVQDLAGYQDGIKEVYQTDPVR